MDCQWTTTAPNTLTCRHCGFTIRTEQPPERVHRNCTVDRPKPGLPRWLLVECILNPSELERCRNCPERISDTCPGYRGSACGRKEYWIWQVQHGQCPRE